MDVSKITNVFLLPMESRHMLGIYCCLCVSPNALSFRRVATTSPRCISEVINILMGVTGLWDLLSPVGHRVSNEHVRNKVLAVDVSIWLTQFIKAMREADGATVRNAHLLGVLRRCVKLLFLAVKPVLIFDGDTPPLKKRTLALRSAARERHAAKLRRLAEKLLLVRLKQSALAAVLPSHVARAAVKASSTFQKKLIHSSDNTQDIPSTDSAELSSKKDGHLSNDAIIDEITPQTPSIDVGTAATKPPRKENSAVGPGETSDASWHSDEERVLGLPEDLDAVDDDTLLSLPPKMQSEVLKQIKMQNRARHREHMLQHRHNPVSFSETQIEAFIRNTTLNRRLANVRNVINEHTGASQRIASDNARQFVFEEKALKDTHGHALDDFDSDDDEEFDGRKPNRLSSNSKPMDILAKIRKENESQRAWQARLSERESKFRNQEKEDRSGVGWASKVLSGGGRLSLSTQQMRSSFRKKEEDDLSDKSVGSHDSAFPNAANDRVVEANGSSLSDNDSNDVEWEDGDADDDLNRSLFSLADQQQSFALDSLGSVNETNKPTDYQVPDELPHAHEVGSSVKATEPDMNSVGTVDDGLKIAKPQLIDIDVDDDSLDKVTKIHDQPSRQTRGLIDIDDIDEDELQTLEHVDETVQESAGPLNSGSVPKLLESDEVKPSEDFGTEGQIQHQSRTVEKDDVGGGQTVIAHKVATPVEDSDQYANKDKILGDGEILPVCRGQSENVNLNCAKVGSLNEFSSGVNGVSLRRPSNTLIDGTEGGYGSKFGEDTGKRVGDVEEDKELQLAIARSLEAESAARLDETLDPCTEQIDHQNNIRIDVDKDTEKRGEVEQKESSRNASCTSGQVRNDEEDEITAVSPPKKAQLPNLKRVEGKSPEMDKGEASNGRADENTDFGIGQGASVEDLKRLQNELQAEERELREQGAAHQAGLETVSDEMYAETRDLLKLLGIPYLQAPMEAEAQCAFLNKEKIVDGVITEDSDCFLFGALSVYRQLFAQGKFAEVYEAEDISQKLGLRREELIRLAYLLGSDYTVGVRGVGVVNSMEILEAFPGENGLQEFKEWTEKVTVLDDEPEEEDMIGASQKAVRTRFCWKHRNMKRNWEIREGFPNAIVFDAYIRPEVDESTEKFKWGRIDFNGLGQFCWDKFGWSAEKFENYISPLKKELKGRIGPQQRRIDEFFKPHRFAKIRSERLQQAVQGIVGDEAKDLMAERLPKIKGRKRKAVTHVAQDVTEDEEMQMVQMLDEVERSINLSQGGENGLREIDEERIRPQTRKRVRRARKA